MKTLRFKKLKTSSTHEDTRLRAPIGMHLSTKTSLKKITSRTATISFRKESSKLDKIEHSIYHDIEMNEEINKNTCLFLLISQRNADSNTS